MVPSSSDFTVVLNSVLCDWLALRWPIYLVYLIGITIAAFRWHRHPRVSRLCALGLGILFFNEFFFLLLGALLAHDSREKSLAFDSGSFVMKFFGVIESIIAAMAYGMLLGAIFIGRSRVAPFDYISETRPVGEAPNTMFREGNPS
jgi:hypothetical protein